MYKSRTIIEINVNPDSIEQTSFGCPTMFEFKDSDGANYYFRFRYGYATLVCENINSILVSDTMGDNPFGGTCDWEDVVSWANEHNVLINISQDD